MSSNLPKSEPSFVRISALASKIDQINKIKALYTNMFGHFFYVYKLDTYETFDTFQSCFNSASFVLVSAAHLDSIF